ncbi:hypothetical protein D049_1548 [Vibrio parahaemolyticus VPTS-2010]|nr:hypothetical protein D049_1548 [Vibrio parahaemolyticus VPTS-2010]
MFFEKAEKCFWSVKHCHHINLGREERSKRIFGQKRVISIGLKHFCQIRRNILKA